ncbi:hypothetical protein A4A49_64122, partial [Nicotiana attenuata]
MQEGHPIAFISKALSPKHATLSVYDRELLAMVHAMTKWSQYLLGQKFIIRTDQKALKYLMEQTLHTNSHWNSDSELKKIIEELENGSFTRKQFTWAQGQLRRKGRLVIGKRLLTLFYWKNMRKEVKDFVLKCDVCQRNNMDFIDGLPKSKGYEVILVVVDRLSKYGHFIPLKHPYTAKSVAQVFLDTVVKLHGLLDTITSDRDVYWYNTSFHSSIQTTPYEALYGRPPPLHLPYSPGESASAEVDNTLINRELKLQLLKHHLMRAQHRMKQQADAHRSDRQFEVGDWVYLKVQPYKQVTITNHTSHKLASKYYGPFQVIKRVGPVAYTLLLPAGVQIHPTVHVSLLKKCYEVPTQIVYPPSLDLASPYCPDPEAVLQRRMVKKGNKAVAQVLVKWQGLPAEAATWEFATVLNTMFP